MNEAAAFAIGITVGIAAGVLANWLLNHIFVRMEDRYKMTKKKRDMSDPLSITLNSQSTFEGLRADKARLKKELAQAERVAAHLAGRLGIKEQYMRLRTRGNIWDLTTKKEFSPAAYEADLNKVRAADETVAARVRLGLDKEDNKTNTPPVVVDTITIDSGKYNTQDLVNILIKNIRPDREEGKDAG